MVRTYLVALLLAAAASSLAAGPRPKVAKSVRVPGAYIFELENGQDVSAFEKTMTGDGKTRMKLEYDLFNGLSFQLRDLKTAKEKVAKYAAMPAVKAIHPVILYDKPNPKIEWIAPKGSIFEQSSLASRAEGEPDTFSTHVMTQVDKLRAKGVTGKGIKVAVVDSGIDYLHPALGGCFGKDCLVSFGHDFVGDAYNGTNTPVPDEDPMDCDGHGTHVAGILAAQNNSLRFTGTAPGVSLGAYRVIGCDGSSASDVLIAAFNKAYQDGADIITASIGGPNGWAGDPWADAVSRIVDKGVPCVVSAMNLGEVGIFYASTAADGQHVSAIASFNNLQTPFLLSLSKYQINDGPEQSFGYKRSKISNWDDVNLSAWASSLDPTIENDACAPFPANTPDLSKYIVLIRRGTCDLSEKIRNAMSKGAKYVLVYNDTPGTVGLEVDLGPISPGAVTAVSIIDKETGETFIKALKDGKKITLKMVGPEKSELLIKTSNNTDTGGAVSTFSSWGPTFEMDVKPQYGTIGGKVLSTYPRAKGSYAVLSGTSMACPQAAGIVALIRQVRGAISPQEIQDLLSSNANPQLFNDGIKFYDYLAPVPQQGGGLVQAHDAAYSTALLSPSGLSFNDTDHFAKSLNFTLRNTDSKPATYKVAHKPAITMYTLAENSIYVDSFPNEAVHAAATLQFSETSITLRGGETKTIKVSATPPEGLDAKRLALWSGYITINGTGGASLSLPYQGLTGSLHEHVVLGSNDTWISESTDMNPLGPSPVPPNTTFTIPKRGTAGPNDLLPQLTLDLALGSPMIRADIVSLGPDPKNETLTHEFWGVKTIGQPHGFPALWNRRGENIFPWDGILDSGSYAPPGTYSFVVRALRINGDAKKREEWDVSTSPTFSIKYL
ncbi:hypothetical protein E4U13_000847 [Claviceps humidiphila]|uniref:Subtilisin-like serine protease n=1 Tax=Claviceps humidiphila TaxID=1294629 RepID=A0A9P7Q6J2_9HYPO|nr:hypothetical protein E4U13_000847 [Claviceps humidiphila]